ncbi:MULTISPECIES: outer membrane lipoprotein chaperone LolA [Methylocaldum]|jgi:outer membrane lipoprotein carrier protein|uniref:outer membrane lipoprotein chaperone LolA n=1 Tax=unclassified Methylocaldum TaxID=2622260 RepID=UPI00098A62AC|nr:MULTISPECIES: outer membrane lipoprotein chaperone LolA [unclassified Methylocaldum]MBP1152082.1 outer membrane lipoprotein carrier protein [Methylocaldum sp. RMAD-M]MDV3242484.1 outer membrane lipoprotein chaperone LolA [Methylocaldum sp.]MVF20594.1 outer membrane lipoprotein chaperone LolA [Methylocaldum sp. BRCS4]
MFKKALLLLLIVLPVFPIAAEEAPVQRLRNFLAKANTLQAEFSQVVIDEAGSPRQRTSGVFYLQRPGKFRWDYKKPYSQEIVSNGGKVWFYDVDLEQVTAKRLDDAIGSTPALLLSGEVALEKNFKIENQGMDEGLFWIKLVPKAEDSGFKYVLIGLDGDTLAGMELSDNFGQLTRIYFTGVKTGLKLDRSLFEFRPPPGVDVFEEK